MCTHNGHVCEAENKAGSQRVPLVTNGLQSEHLTLQGLLSPRITTFGDVTLLKYGAISSIASSSSTCSKGGMHSHGWKTPPNERKEPKTVIMNFFPTMM